MEQEYIPLHKSGEGDDLYDNIVQHHLAQAEIKGPDYWAERGVTNDIRFLKIERRIRILEEAFSSEVQSLRQQLEDLRNE